MTCIRVNRVLYPLRLSLNSSERACDWTVSCRAPWSRRRRVLPGRRYCLYPTHSYQTRRRRRRRLRRRRRGGVCRKTQPQPSAAASPRLRQPLPPRVGWRRRRRSKNRRRRRGSDRHRARRSAGSINSYSFFNRSQLHTRRRPKLKAQLRYTHAGVYAVRHWS